MKILLIEDEGKLNKLLCEGLAKIGYAVETSLKGDEGLNMILSYHDDYDCILLDNMLPGISGYEICKIIRKEGIHTPILMLTAKDSTKDKVEGLNAGADDYLVKPFDFDELIARLQALMRRPKAFVPDILKIRDLEINLNEHSIKKQGNIIPLTTKESMILEYLIKFAGTVISKERLITHTTSDEVDNFSNVIEVHIKNIRKKLGDAEKPYIETIKNAGYKFVE